MTRIALRILPLLAILLVGTVADSAVGARNVAFTAPKITSSSLHGSVGATVKVMGSGLGDTSRAVFAGNAAATIVSKADGEVDVVVPTTARDGNLTLTTPGGQASVPFRVVPKVSGVTAESHTVGSAVTINGSGLGNPTYVTINDASASFHVVSPNEIKARIPATAQPMGHIRVSTHGGQASSDYFRVAPSITGFSPANATTGTTIKIGGSGFGGYPYVRFSAGGYGHITELSLATIKVIVPDGAGSGPITVSTSGGVATSAGQFTVKPWIPITSQPLSGLAGATVKIMGSGLAHTSSAVFAGNAAATIVSNTSREVDVVIPATARNGKLTLTTPGGTASILFRAVPKLSGFSADSHTVGSTVTITGSGLADLSYVHINFALASFHVVSPNEVRAKIPADAHPSGRIEVTDSSNRTATSATPFYVLPTISGFSPASAAAGSTITITGTGFSFDAHVSFASSGWAHITFSSHTVIKVILPFTAGTGHIAVQTSGGTATSAGTFTSIGGPDFMLTAGPTRQTVSRGGQTTYRVTMTSSHGFSGPVQLSVSGSPLGSGRRAFLVSTFSSNPVSAGGVGSTLTVKTDALAERGTYTLTITGVSGSLSHTVQVSITLQ